MVRVDQLLDDDILNRIDANRSINMVLCRKSPKKINLRNVVSNRLLENMLKENIKFIKYPRLEKIRLCNPSKQSIDSNLANIIEVFINGANLQCSDNLIGYTCKLDDAKRIDKMLNLKKTICLENIIITKWVLDLFEGLDFDYLILFDCHIETELLDVSKFILIFNSTSSITNLGNKEKIICIGNKIIGCGIYFEHLFEECEYLTEAISTRGVDLLEKLIEEYICEENARTNVLKRRESDGVNSEEYRKYLISFIRPEQLVTKQLLLGICNYMDLINNSIKVKKVTNINKTDTVNLFESKHLNINASDLDATGVIDISNYRNAEIICLKNYKGQKIIIRNPNK